MGNAQLRKAKKAKFDEFYTSLGDIEKEVAHYEDHLRGKRVYCNADDPRTSNFYRFFALNFFRLGLTGLIASSYREGGIGTAVEMDRTGREKEIPLRGDGDFRSPECEFLLRKSDVVITNPPFSLFRDFAGLLMKHGKKFLIMGPMDAITHGSFFSLIMAREVWMGVNVPKWFEAPTRYGKKPGKVENGRELYSFGRTVWWTNLSHGVSNEEIALTERYSPEKYPTYDNYDAIEVGRVSRIPRDWKGVMGVPISFIGRWNPDQFELVGAAAPSDEGFKNNKTYDGYDEFKADGTKLPSRKKSSGSPFLRGRKEGGSYMVGPYGDVVRGVYYRLFIRNRNPEKTGLERS